MERVLRTSILMVWPTTIAIRPKSSGLEQEENLPNHTTTDQPTMLACLIGSIDGEPFFTQKRKEVKSVRTYERIATLTPTTGRINSLSTKKKRIGSLFLCMCLLHSCYLAFHDVPVMI